MLNYSGTRWALKSFQPESFNDHKIRHYRNGNNTTSVPISITAAVTFLHFQISSRMSCSSLQGHSVSLFNDTEMMIPYKIQFKSLTTPPPLTEPHKDANYHGNLKYWLTVSFGPFPVSYSIGISNRTARIFALFCNSHTTPPSPDWHNL